MSFESETSLQDAYIQALRTSTRYIYIEDQYFTPNFSDAAYGSWVWSGHASPMSELKGALRRRVQLFVVVPSTEPNGPGIRAMRDNAVDGLRAYAAQHGAPPPLIVRLRTPIDGRRDQHNRVHVHSKLLICDDEYAIVGSHNLNARSFANDIELAIGFTGPAVVELRRRLWAEHEPDTRQLDEAGALDLIRHRVDGADSRLVSYVPQARGYPPGPLKRLVWRLSETVGRG
jgi:phosphatidylserine/phosphatidylglycerophosphate/cardiolipin synthase-like enzyme